MGIPTISKRLHYRSVPGEAAEPTSTIVLTSKDLHYVDIRILKEKHSEDNRKAISDLDCLDWAFAGKSRTIKDPKSGDGPGSRSHTVWDHWIDSKGDEGDSDEGDMTVQEDGCVLEEGVNVDPVSGNESKYEELWKDLPVDPIGKKQNRHSIVLKADDPEQNIRGLVVKIGGWCQGIMKKDGQLTIERWQRKPKAADETERSETTEVEESNRTRNDWIRTFKIGTETLACEHICDNTSGKLGMSKRTFIKDIEWRVIEEYYW